MTILEIVLLYLVVLISFVIFLFLINFKWVIGTIRAICHPDNEGGYTKLIQLSIMFCLFVIFVIIVIYFILNPEKVDGINIILTVIVGWLGAIIGQFFGEKTMENLDIKRKEKVKTAGMVIEKLIQALEKHQKTIELIKKLKKK